MRRRAGRRVALVAALAVAAGIIPATPITSREMRRTCGTSGRIVTWKVWLERGLHASKGSTAQRIHSVLCDKRSWIGGGTVRFRYDPKHGKVFIGLRSANGTERRCKRLIGLSVRRYFSCASRAHREIVLNWDRWIGGSRFWPGGVTAYRHMLVNHEMGHILRQGHRGCSRRGAKAPVMMQQSKGLQGCKKNPYPLSYERRRAYPPR